MTQVYCVTVQLLICSTNARDASSTCAEFIHVFCIKFWAIRWNTTPYFTFHYNIWMLECGLITYVSVKCTLEVRCGFVVFLQMNNRRAGPPPTFLEGTGASPGWPRTTWAFPKTPCPCQVSRALSALLRQTDRLRRFCPRKTLCSQLATTPGISSPSAHINVSVSACPLPSALASAQGWVCVARPAGDPLKDPNKYSFWVNIAKTFGAFQSTYKISHCEFLWGAGLATVVKILSCCFTHKCNRIAHFLKSICT